MKRVLFVSIVAVFIMVLVGGVISIGCAPASPEKVVLKALVPWPVAYPFIIPFQEVVKRINQVAPERLEIQILGGPEVIPTFEQMGALREGSIDLLYAVGSYYAGEVPEAEAFLLLGRRATAVDLRKIGMLDLQDEIHRQKIGVTLLGTIIHSSSSRFYLKEPVYKADFTGLKIRSVSCYDATIEALGGTPVTVDTGDVYVALETGVLDAIGWSGEFGFAFFKLYEVCHYVLDPPMDNTGSGRIAANAQRWDALPKDVKKIIIDQVVAYEPEVSPWYIEFNAKALDEMLAAGTLEMCVLPPEEAEEFLRISNEVEWKDMITDKCPEWGPKLFDIAAPLLGLPERLRGG